MKIRLIVMLVVIAWAMTAWCQSPTITTQIVDADFSQTFPGCSDDNITVAGNVKLKMTVWTDSDGTHTRSQVVSYNLTATSDVGITYAVKFMQKEIIIVSDNSADEDTLLFRLQLMGPGALDTRQITLETHSTEPQGLGTPPARFTFTSKCTG